MSRTNIPFWVWKRGSPTFFDLGIFLNIDLKVVLCLTWRNFCQFWDQFLTDRIFWATFPKHSQNKCFYHVLILSTTVLLRTLDLPINLLHYFFYVQFWGLLPSPSQILNDSHCYFTRSNLKKMGPLKFCSLALLGIHRHPM